VGELTTLPRLLAVFKRPTSKGGRRKGEGREGEGREGKVGEGCPPNWGVWIRQ